MKIAVIGTGYVGLPTGVGLAEFGNEVVCVDKDDAKINSLKQGKITIFEDGMDDLFFKNTQNGRLKFTTSMKEGVATADLVILAVGTPPDPLTKAADMKYIDAAADELALYISGYTVVAVKSTVPVNTGDRVEQIIARHQPSEAFDVISLPEFLREGYAIDDFFNPDRIIVGTDSARAKALIADLYRPLADKTQILFVKRHSAEVIKYASNAFLAMKIHYINEMADFCEQADADIYEVARGMGADTRIGHRFLNPGPGFGGFCFPKDTNAMACMGRQFGVPLTLVETTINGNEARQKRMADKILSASRDQANPKIAVWGTAFKGGTDDCRESPAIRIIQALVAQKADVTVYDPKALENARRILGDGVSYATDMYAAAEQADVLAVLTEWNEFKTADLKYLKRIMKQAKIVDLRRLIDANAAKEAGFELSAIGVRTVF
jgi:UDPglucose 6-dehydrogenase